MQWSPVFDRDGDSWQLQLKPINAKGDVELYLKLVSKDRPADYRGDRCLRFTALHPLVAWASQSLESGESAPFVPQGQVWGYDQSVKWEHVSNLLHNGWLTIQALVWKTEEEERKKEEEKEETKEKDKAECSICMSAPAACLLRCCNSVKSCDACIEKLLEKRRPMCPFCRSHLCRDNVAFSVQA